MSIFSWLEGIEPQAWSDAELRQIPKTRKRKQQQIPTPTASTTDMNINPDATPPSNKRRRSCNANDDNDDLDMNRTPRGWGKALSNLDRTSSRSSTSRISFTKRLAALEITTDKPVSVVQINRTDARMPEELKTMLNGLDGF